MLLRALPLLLFAIALFALTESAAQPAPGSALRAGAAAMKITPSLDRPVYIAGYDNNRVAESVHDDLWARALVLDDGKTRMAVVVCDLIGLSNYRTRQIRERITSVPKANVLVATTHVHSGPDTLGLWGPTAFQSGLDPRYLATLEQRIADAVEGAARALRPATLSVGRVEVPDGFVYNSREPIQDKDLTALRLRDPAGATIATVIHYGGHPEVNKGTALTSDFVHYVRGKVERRFGGTALFLNGALGGMVTPKVSEHTLAEMERVGQGVGDAAVAAIEKAAPVEVPAIRLEQKALKLPLENQRFKLAAAAKLLDVGPLADSFETEVWRVDLGPVTWITLPGEVLPKPALALNESMPARYHMVVAMSNYELGYILDPEDFDKPRYKYERSMSVGKQTWPLLHAAARDLLGR
jgi:hypothetical protein